MAIFESGDVQLVKPGDELYFGKPVKINEHGNNAAIKVHILDEATMKLNGFRWVHTLKEWYFCQRVYADIMFNMSIKSENDWKIDILDEMFCQPYDYQHMLENWPEPKIPRAARVVQHNVDEIMDSFKHKGIISGWEVGDYI